MSEVSIKGIDKVELVKALYDGSQPLGLGRLHFTPEPLADDEAAQWATGYMDYVRGRVIKCDVRGETMGTHLYNRDNGAGAAEAAVEIARGETND